MKKNTRKSSIKGQNNNRTKPVIAERKALESSHQKGKREWDTLDKEEKNYIRRQRIPYRMRMIERACDELKLAILAHYCAFEEYGEIVERGIDSKPFGEETDCSRYTSKNTSITAVGLEVAIRKMETLINDTVVTEI